MVRRKPRHVAHVVDDLARGHQLEAAALLGPRLGVDVAHGELGVGQPAPGPLDRGGRHVEPGHPIGQRREVLGLVALAAADLEQRAEVVAQLALDDRVGLGEARLLLRRRHVPRVGHLVGEVEAIVGVVLPDRAQRVLHPRPPHRLLGALAGRGGAGRQIELDQRGAEVAVAQVLVGGQQIVFGAHAVSVRVYAKPGAASCAKNIASVSSRSTATRARLRRSSPAGRRTSSLPLALVKPSR